ncbi:hypothetical protein ODY43_04165 [Aerococcus urinae]|uniref:Uncharacterized protein n=1 Tax=Aerococcus urinae TaxID=1376 RepID=A0ABT4C437_9LACT|nr:hypothetical protein [Aerococcus urinae]MCY3053179.1 hypothetical protein [Aerococcus urinae]MCY3058694.1 hypothetical protein [Aerococcus urinae]
MIEDYHLIDQKIASLCSPVTVDINQSDVPCYQADDKKELGNFSQFLLGFHI